MGMGEPFKKQVSLAAAVWHAQIEEAGDIGEKSMTTPPIYFTWTGESMEPLARFSRLAEKSFTAGYAYRMIIEEERSAASHRQYMATVHEGWMQLPEPWD